MKLIELNSELVIQKELDNISKYEQEFLERLNENLLEEGISDWIKEKTETGNYLVSLFKPENSKLLYNVSSQINKWTFSQKIKPFLKVIRGYIQKFSNFIQDNVSSQIVEKLNIIKEKLTSLMNFILDLYRKITSKSGIIKFVAALGFSGIAAKVFDSVRTFFDYLKDISLDNIIEKMKDFLSQTNFYDKAVSMKDELLTGITKVTGDLSGVTSVLSFIDGIKSAISYVFAIIKSIKNKFNVFAQLDTPPQTQQPVPA